MPEAFASPETVTEAFPIFEIIETKKGDCSEHAHLFTTIARSFGFPARTVSGYAYGEGTYGAHAWNEVLIEIEVFVCRHL